MQSMAARLSRNGYFHGKLSTMDQMEEELKMPTKHDRPTQPDAVSNPLRSATYRRAKDAISFDRTKPPVVVHNTGAKAARYVPLHPLVQE